MLKKPKILVVGSFMMDLIALTSRAPSEGETVIGLEFRTAPGGKGANQAVQCARLGADVTMVGCVGDDSFGKTMVEALKSAGVDVSHVLVKHNFPSGVGSITLEVNDTNAKNRIVVCPGANYAITEDDINWLKASIKEYDLVMMQLEIPINIVEIVAKWAKSYDVPVMLNPAPASSLSDSLLSNVTYLSPNEHEAGLMSGHNIDVSNGIDKEDVKKVAEWFIKRGVNSLIITLGGNGSVVVSNGEIGFTNVVKMPRVADTTAAGDSFVAAFCTAVSSGIDEKSALEFASYTAAITVSRMGAIPSLPTIKEVQKLIYERNSFSLNPEIFNILK